MATRWQQVQKFIDAEGGAEISFMSTDYAHAMGLTPAKASVDIQAYLTAQRGARSRTKYVLKRQPGTRTRSARWSVGERKADVRIIGRAFSDDTKAKWMRAAEPDILRIAAINPAAARRAETLIEAVFDGALTILEAAVKA